MSNDRGAPESAGTDGEDDALLAELAAAVRPPEVSPTALDAARGSYVWRTVDAELAALAHDSATDPTHVGVVRGQDDVRTLSFAGDGVVLEVELASGRLVGQVVPARAGDVELQVASGLRVRGEVDDRGTFVLPVAPEGAFRLVYRERGGREVVTAWVA